MSKGVIFMTGKFIAGVTAGTIIGITAGVMMSPEMDRNTKRRLRRSGRYMMEAAGEAFHDIRYMMR